MTITVTKKIRASLLERLLGGGPALEEYSATVVTSDVLWEEGQSEQDLALNMAKALFASLPDEHQDG